MENKNRTAGLEISVRPTPGLGQFTLGMDDLRRFALEESFHIGEDDAALNSFPLPLRNPEGFPASPIRTGDGFRYERALSPFSDTEQRSECLDFSRSGQITLSHVRKLTGPDRSSLMSIDLCSYLVWFHYYVSRAYIRLGYAQSVDYRVRRWDANGNSVAVEVPLVPLENVGSAPGYEGPEGAKLAEAVLAEIAAKELCRH